MNTQENGTLELTVNEKQLREGIMPRAQLSKAACEIALQKTANKSVKQFAEWELMEATTVIKVLEDVGTKASPIAPDAKAFLDQLTSLEGKEFDQQYMQAELSNHEFLRGLAQQFIDGYDEELTGKQEIGHVSNLALFAFTEHVGLCKNIIAEL
jgi:putative membrane protein